MSNPTVGFNQKGGSVEKCKITVGLVFAVGPLLNLEAAQRGRSMLLSDEQNLLLKEGKRGLHRTP